MYPVSKILVIIDNTWSSSFHLANNHKLYEKLPRTDERLQINSTLFDFFYFSTVNHGNQNAWQFRKGAAFEIGFK